MRLGKPQVFLMGRRCISLLKSIDHPRRVMMYVPGDNSKMLQKIPKLKADCIVMDCEDGVATNRKEEARKLISKTLRNLIVTSSEICVRINAVCSGLAEQDLHAIFDVHSIHPKTIMLPKVEGPKDLETLNGWLKKLEIIQQLKLVIFVESAVGLLNLESSCRAAAKFQSFMLMGIVFGSDDFCASIGATRTTPGDEMIYARQKTVVIAKAFGLQAIDMVHIDLNDLDGLREQSRRGYGMGFTGKQAIHPSQVDIIQQAFSPSDEQIRWAEQLVEAFQDHHRSGQGAFRFNGSMIDAPLLLQAQNILEIARKVS